MIKKIIKSLFLQVGYEIKAVNNQLVNKKTGHYDGSLYRPLYCPWFGDLDFIDLYKKCSEKKVWFLEIDVLLFIKLYCRRFQSKEI